MFFHPVLDICFESNAKYFSEAKNILHFPFTESTRKELA